MLNQISYPAFVAALAKPGQAIIDSLTPGKADLIHFAIGLSGEIDEIVGAIDLFQASKGPEDRKALCRELGDLLWYLQASENAAKKEFSFQGCILETYREDWMKVTGPEEIPLEGLVSSISVINDRVKRYVIFNHPADTQFEGVSLSEGFSKALIDAATHLSVLTTALGFTPQEVEYENMDKLSVRYEKLVYSDQAAKARADETKSPSNPT